MREIKSFQYSEKQGFFHYGDATSDTSPHYMELAINVPYVLTHNFSCFIYEHHNLSSIDEKITFKQIKMLFECFLEAAMVFNKKEVNDFYEKYWHN